MMMLLKLLISFVICFNYVHDHKDDTLMSIYSALHYVKNEACIEN